MIPEQSQADYARRRGVTPTAIGKAIASGRIPSSAVRRVGRGKMIDVAAADLALGQSILRTNSPGDLPMASSGEISPPSSPSAGPETPGLTAARESVTLIDARIKQLTLDERLGKLRSVEDVTRSMEICAAAMVRDLDQLPVHADNIATAFARNGVDGVRSLLKQIARDTRTTMANNMRLLTADETADNVVDGSVEEIAA